MRIAVHGRPFKAETLPFIREFFKELHSYRPELFIEQTFRDQCVENQLKPGEHKVFSNLHGLPEVDTIISLGGDGTLLEAITYAKDSGIPIFGINTGRMGYLATTKKEDFGESLRTVMSGESPLDERNMVQLLSEDRELFGDFNFALNEVAILKRDTSSMIVAHAYVNGDYLTSYWGDGVLVSTPTGSTGYSLSCGGPLVLPRSQNLIITPICPHNLNLRPLVVPDDSDIELEIEGRSNNILISLDSRSITVENNIKLRIKKADFQVKLHAPQGLVHFKTLREKLSWGRDIRN